MRRYSKIGLERRQKEREGYSDFYLRHISKIKTENLRCEECNSKLIGNASEVAHVLPKNLYKSVATNDENVVYLCGFQSENNCHSKFDNSSNKDYWNMFVFELAKEKFNILKEITTEKITYKTIDRVMGPD